MKQKESSENSVTSHQGVLAIILAPTRELALQVHMNLQDVAKAVSLKVSFGWKVFSSLLCMICTMLQYSLCLSHLNTLGKSK